jgi:hypothetical protein
MSSRKTLAAHMSVFIYPAMEFICRRLNKVRPDQADDAVKRAVIDLFRSNIPLDGDPKFRQHVADELEMLYFKTPQERRLVRGESGRRVRAAFLRGQINFVAEQENISPDEAIKKIAARDDTSVEAIKQALKPSRIAGKKSRKK